jgi:hypothetical protein
MLRQVGSSSGQTKRAAPAATESLRSSDSEAQTFDNIDVEEK